MPDDKPFISVIIPAYNDHAALALCLDALEQQTYPADCYEVVVVDNNSNPPLDSAVSRFAHAVLVKETRRGSYAARNTGIATARGAYLAFTDSDCLPAPDWLAKGVNWLQQHADCGLIGGRVEVFAHNPAHPTAVELYELLFAFPMKHYVEDQHFAATCNIFTFRAVFDTVGPFDAALQSGGDSEWGARVHAHHYSQFYADDVVIRHPARRTWAALNKKHLRTVSGYVPHNAASASRGILPPLIRRHLHILHQSSLTFFQKAQVLGVMLVIYGMRGLSKLRRRLSR